MNAPDPQPVDRPGWAWLVTTAEDQLVCRSVRDVQRTYPDASLHPVPFNPGSWWIRQGHGHEDIPMTAIRFVGDPPRECRLCGDAGWSTSHLEAYGDDRHPEHGILSLCNCERGRRLGELLDHLYSTETETTETETTETEVVEFEDAESAHLRQIAIAYERCNQALIEAITAMAGREST